MISTKAIGLISATVILSAITSQSGVATQSKILDNLRVPSQQKMLFSTFAKGVQIYACQVSDKGEQYKWVLKAPLAVLLDPKTGKTVGKHYAGPTWEALDGSKVVGQVKNKVSAPDVKNIPWLLLTAKSDANKGMFGNINYIQRVDTVGGLAPATGCNSYNVGKEARVEYTANYHFFGI